MIHDLEIFKLACVGDGLGMSGLTADCISAIIDIVLPFQRWYEIGLSGERSTLWFYGEILVKIYGPELMEVTLWLLNALTLPGNIEISFCNSVMRNRITQAGKGTLSMRKHGKQM